MKRPLVPARKPILNGSTIALYAEGGPVQRAQDFWLRVRDQWNLPWSPFNGSTLAVVAGILGPVALDKFCEAMGDEVAKAEVLGYLATIVDKGNRLHPDVRAQFPGNSRAIVNLSHIDDRLAAIPLLSENVRVWCFRRARANHNRTLRAKTAA